ncbi:O-antigen ligase family protein [Pseudoalteromonas arctica]|uniref:O-antigen ligase family protein n=1 Tax=Pseudoalteromonas arctica TaxID=394751 RepID=A0ABU9TD20_9GAMM
MFSIKVRNIESLLFFISAALVPMYFTDFRFDGGSLIIRLSDLMAVFVILCFLFLFSKNKIKIKIPAGFSCILLFLIYCFCNALLKAGLVKALISTVQWSMILFSLVVVYSNAVKNPERFRVIFINTLLTICFFTVLHHFLDGHFIRYKSLGDTKYAFALTGVVLLSCFFYFNDKNYLKPLVFLYPIILLSLERKGILVFHVVLVFYIFYTLKPLHKLFLAAIIASFILIFVIFFDLSFLNDFTFFEYSELEMLYLDEEKAKWISNMHRQSLLENGWHIFTEHPLFGVGPKMLLSYMSHYYVNQGIVLYTHNVFLDSLIEQGIFGLFLLLLPHFVYYIKQSKKMVNREKAVFFSFCVYSYFMLFFMSAGAPSMILLYLPIFMGFVIHRD